MNTVIVVLILLLAVAGSVVVVKLSPIKLPTPLFQIALGAILASPFIGLHVELDPEIFLLLFIPPILFSDGWRFPKKEFALLWRPIMALAIGLVLFTIACMGYFIHWLVPPITLPAAFALAAVLSPTDAVAVASISGGAKLPPRLMHVLEGESLMNDATGLVAFNFAILASIQGEFSLLEASGSFILIAVGGFVIGVIVSWVASLLQQQISKYTIDEPGIQVVLLLLIPFAAYLVAEELDVSGILAAVGAGMAMSYTQTHHRTSTAARLLGNSVWSMLEFVFNGMTFILLGLQIPRIFGGVDLDQMEAGHVSVSMLIFYVIAIGLALLVVRFLWVLVADFVKNPKVHKNSPYPRLLVVLVATFAGVRGAITMAAIMATPLIFQQRNLLIFLATGVILFSLILGSVLLPQLARKFSDLTPDPLLNERRNALQHIAKSAIVKIDQLRFSMLTELEHPDEKQTLDDVADILKELYEREAYTHSDNHDEMHVTALAHAYETVLRLEAVREERRELYQLYSRRQISQPTLSVLLRDIDLRETSIESRKKHLTPKMGH